MSEGKPAVRNLKILVRGRVRVGDAVRAVTEAFGIRPCEGCERRRQALNRLEIRL